MKGINLRKQFPWSWMLFFALGTVFFTVTPYLTLNPAHFNIATSRFAVETPLRQAGLYIHIFSGALALLIGPFQFLNRLRQNKPRLHRWMGRFYLLGILVSGLTTFLIAPGMIAGMAGEAGLITLAILWLWTGWNAYSAIRAGNKARHREWMIRNYALTFAAVTIRLWLGMLIGTQIPFLETKYSGDFEALFVEVYRAVMWLGWVPNLIIAEFLVQPRPGSRVSSLHKPGVVKT